MLVAQSTYTLRIDYAATNHLAPLFMWRLSTFLLVGREGFLGSQTFDAAASAGSLSFLQRRLIKSL